MVGKVKSEPVSYNRWQDNGLLPGGVPWTIADVITNRMMMVIQEPRSRQPSHLCCQASVAFTQSVPCQGLVSILPCSASGGLCPKIKDAASFGSNSVTWHQIMKPKLSVSRLWLHCMAVQSPCQAMKGHSHDTLQSLCQKSE